MFYRTAPEQNAALDSTNEKLSASSFNSSVVLVKQKYPLHTESGFRSGHDSTDRSGTRDVLRTHQQPLNPLHKLLGHAAKTRRLALSKGVAIVVPRLGHLGISKTLARSSI